MSAQAAWRGDGRLHLQHGPIDLLCQAWGELGEVTAAYEQAMRAFPDVLPTLCAELALLRARLLPLPPGEGRGEGQCSAGPNHKGRRWPQRSRAALHPPSLQPSPEGKGGGSAALPQGEVARAMRAACLPFADQFITPMAAVAGAVADHVLAAMVQGRRLRRAVVNNGGDIALHIQPGEAVRCGVVTNLQAPALDGVCVVRGDEPWRGVATSGRACKGRGGKSFSFGIADSVTVMARTGAEADAAASVIGNAVDLPGHPAVQRRPASDVDPSSDLGDRLITWDVGALTPAECARALERGRRVADGLKRRGLIGAAVLALQGHAAFSHGPLPHKVEAA